MIYEFIQISIIPYYLKFKINLYIIFIDKIRRMIKKKGVEWMLKVIYLVIIKIIEFISAHSSGN